MSKIIIRLVTGNWRKAMELQDIDGLKKEYENYRFKYLEQIGDGICLSWDKETGKLCRLRSISEEQGEVYHCLQVIENSHLPDILYISDNFVAEEYINGSSLKERSGKGSLSSKEVKNILKQLLPAIQQLHQNGVIHRDIKASNIMSDKYGKYYLVDFDIAIERGTGSETAGTAGYASPEQYGYRDCDARSDIYSIGVLINVLLTGHMPKDGIAKGRFGRIIKKCVMIEPKDRYQTVEELYCAVFVGKRRITKSILVCMVCAMLMIFAFIWWPQNSNTGGVRSTGEAEETNTTTVNRDGVYPKTAINSVTIQWVELEDYNISYPCLQGMERVGAGEVKGTDIQEIEKNMPAWRNVQENAFEMQYYYKTEDNAWFSMSVVRDVSGMTGYAHLEEGLESRKENLAYADASNVSFCYGETFNDDNVLYYAGTVKNGLWLYMAMLCPKAYENEYKKYLEAWRNSIKATGTVYSWQDKWADYAGGRYTNVQRNEDNSVTMEHCLEIQAVSGGEIIFSITKTKQEYWKKSISTTGYIREYIIDNSVVFTGEWSGEGVQGFLRRGVDEKHIILNYDGKGLILEKEE